MVPDFACTGFMMQGQTLDAALADCGDIRELPGLTEMITSYVILSRVRKADGLLLMRAFSPYLFRLGSAPGPACLLKLLRRKFTGTAQSSDDRCGHEEAIVEYEFLTKKWETEKKLQRSEGMQWRCCMCGHVLPARGYGDASTLTLNAKLEELCITQGHWRRCQACAEVPSVEDHVLVECAGPCKQQRERFYFEEDSLTCKACIFPQRLRMYVCSQCQNVKRYEQIGVSGAEASKHVCYKCAPERQLLACTICLEKRPATEFKGDITTLRKETIRRCNGCRTCKGCGIRHENASKMQWNSAFCCIC